MNVVHRADRGAISPAGLEIVKDRVANVDRRRAPVAARFILAFHHFAAQSDLRHTSPLGRRAPEQPGTRRGSDRSRSPNESRSPSDQILPPSRLIRVEPRLSIPTFPSRPRSLHAKRHAGDDPLHGRHVDVTVEHVLPVDLILVPKDHDAPRFGLEIATTEPKASSHDVFHTFGEQPAARIDRSDGRRHRREDLGFVTLPAEVGVNPRPQLPTATDAQLRLRRPPKQMPAIPQRPTQRPQAKPVVDADAIDEDRDDPRPRLSAHVTNAQLTSTASVRARRANSYHPMPTSPLNTIHRNPPIFTTRPRSWPKSAEDAHPTQGVDNKHVSSRALP